jgi:hypothetical protein
VDNDVRMGVVVVRRFVSWVLVGLVGVLVPGVAQAHRRALNGLSVSSIILHSGSAAEQRVAVPDRVTVVITLPTPLLDYAVIIGGDCARAGNVFTCTPFGDDVRIRYDNAAYPADLDRAMFTVTAEAN